MKLFPWGSQKRTAWMVRLCGSRMPSERELDLAGGELDPPADHDEARELNSEAGAFVVHNECIMAHIFSKLDAENLANCSAANARLRQMAQVPLDLSNLNVAVDSTMLLAPATVTSLTFHSAGFCSVHVTACTALNFVLPRFPALLSLSLTLPNVSERYVCRVLHTCSTLTSLSSLTLESCSLCNSAGLALTETLPSLGNLAQLRLPFVALADHIADKLLTVLPSLARLTALDLTGHSLSQALLLRLMSDQSAGRLQLDCLRVVRGSGYCPWLTQPDLTAPNTTDAIWTRPARFTELHTDCTLLRAGPTALEPLTQVRVLHMDGHNAGLELIAHATTVSSFALASLTALRDLSLPAMLLESASDVFSVLARLSELRSLAVTNPSPWPALEAFLGGAGILGVPDPDLRDTRGLSQLTALTRLHLHNTEHPDEDTEAVAAALACLTALRSLRIALPQVAIPALAALVQLTFLHLETAFNARDAPTPELENALGMLPELKELCVKPRGEHPPINAIPGLSTGSVTRICLEGFGVFKNMLYMPFLHNPQLLACTCAALQDLTLSIADILHENPGWLEVLPVLTGLTGLALTCHARGNAGRPQDWRVLTDALPNLSRLQDLVLDFQRTVSHAVVEELAGSLWACTRLTSLQVHFPMSVQALAQTSVSALSSTFSRLRKLRNLSVLCGVPMDGVLKSISQLPLLTSLSLVLESIGSIDAHAMHMRQLQRLSMVWNLRGESMYVGSLGSLHLLTGLTSLVVIAGPPGAARDLGDAAVISIADALGQLPEIDNVEIPVSDSLSESVVERLCCALKSSGTLRHVTFHDITVRKGCALDAVADLGVRPRPPRLRRWIDGMLDTPVAHPWLKHHWKSDTTALIWHGLG